jgi:hypothetical protein
MATEKQLQANRQNALKSTGPRSLAGKMIASRNSTRHGFYATSILLPEEDREEFLYLARRLVSAYNPSGVREEELVRTIIETRWQLRRANLVDSELFQIYGFYKGQNRGVGTAFAQDAVQGNAFSKLTRYQSFLLRKLHLTEQELSRVKAEARLPGCCNTFGFFGGFGIGQVTLEKVGEQHRRLIKVGFSHFDARAQEYDLNAAANNLPQSAKGRNWVFSAEPVVFLDQERVAS